MLAPRLLLPCWFLIKLCSYFYSYYLQRKYCFATLERLISAGEKNSLRMAGHAKTGGWPWGVGGGHRGNLPPQHVLQVLLRFCGNESCFMQTTREAVMFEQKRFPSFVVSTYLRWGGFNSIHTPNEATHMYPPLTWDCQWAIGTPKMLRGGCLNGGGFSLQNEYGFKGVFKMKMVSGGVILTGKVLDGGNA